MTEADKEERAKLYDRYLNDRFVISVNNTIAAAYAGSVPTVRWVEDKYDMYYPPAVEEYVENLKSVLADYIKRYYKELYN